MSVNQLELYINNKIITIPTIKLDSIGNIWCETNDNVLNESTWKKSYKKYTSMDDIILDYASNTKTARVLEGFFNYTQGTFRDTNGYLGVIKTETKNATEGYTLIKNVKFQPLLDAKYGALQMQHSFVDDAKEINDTYYEYVKGFNKINFTSCAVYDDEGNLLEKESLQKVVDVLNNKKAFACKFELIDNGSSNFDIKINTRSYGDLHRIDIVNFGFDENLNSIIGDNVVDLGLYLFTNKQQSCVSTKNLYSRLNNFVNPAKNIGSLSLVYKAGASEEQSTETIDVSLQNITTIADIKKAIARAIKEKRETTGYNGIFKNINVIVCNNEIVFVGSAVANGGSLTLTSTTVGDDKVDLADVLYFDSVLANTTAKDSSITEPTLGTDCVYDEDCFITDYIKNINKDENDSCCIFMSTVNYSFKDIEKINSLLSGMQRVSFMFVIGNALDTKYLTQYTKNSETFTGAIVVEGGQIDINKTLARRLTLLGSADIAIKGNSKKIGDLLSVSIPDLLLTMNTERAEYAAENGYEVAYYGKQQQENVFGTHNSSTSFGITNVFYVNYIIRAINNAELLFKAEKNGVIYNQAGAKELLLKIQSLCTTLSLNNMFNTEISEEKIVQMAQKLNVNAINAISKIRENGFFTAIETPEEMSARGSLVPNVYVIMAFGQALYGVNNYIGLMI